MSAKPRIVEVRVAGDLEPEIEWDVVVQLHRFTSGTVDLRLHLTGWHGDVCFSREPGSDSAGRYRLDRRRLRARLVSTPTQGLQSYETQNATFTLATPATPNLMERIEAFRAGGKLLARVEGEFAAIRWSRKQETVVTSEPYQVTSEFFELPKDTWCEEFLPKLLPPGKLVVEVDLSKEIELMPAYRDALTKARTAFYENRYEDMVRELFIIVDKIPRVPDEPRYQGALRKTIGGLRELMNLYRHRKPEVPPMDRNTARFILLSMMQLDVVSSVLSDHNGPT